MWQRDSGPDSGAAEGTRREAPLNVPQTSRVLGGSYPEGRTRSRWSSLADRGSEATGTSEGEDAATTSGRQAHSAPLGTGSQTRRPSRSAALPPLQAPCQVTSRKMCSRKKNETP